MMVKKLMKKVEFAELAGVSQSRVTRLIAKELKKAVVGRRIDADHPSVVAYLQKRQVAHAGMADGGLDARYLEAVTMCTKSGVWSPAAIKRGLNVGKLRAKRIFTLMQSSGVVPDALESEPMPRTVLSGPRLNGNSGSVPPQNSHSVSTPLVQFVPEAVATNGRVAVSVMEAPPEIPTDIMEFADLTITEVITRYGTVTALQDLLKVINTLEGINGKRLKNAQEAGVLVSRAVVETHIIGPMDAMLVRMLQDLPKTLSLQVANWVSAGESSLKIEKSIRELLTGFISPMKEKVDRVVKKEMKGKRSD